jgi:hypothetical protein
MESFMEVGQGPNWGCSAKEGGKNLTEIGQEIDSPESEQRTAVGSPEQNNEPSNSIKGEHFLSS